METDPQPRKTKSQPFLNAVVAILLLFMVGFIAIYIYNAKSNSKNEAPSLNIKVNRGLEGITVTNNESGQLTGCKLTINGEYTLNANMIDSEPRLYSYTDFTSGGTRFDILTTQPESLSVSNCDENPDRFGAYDW